MWQHSRTKRRTGRQWMKVRDGSVVKRWRERRHYTQRDLAYLVRCSQNTISLIEVGKLPTVSEHLALDIAKRLDVPWEDLFEQRDNARVQRVVNGARSRHRSDGEAA